MKRYLTRQGIWVLILTLFIVNFADAGSKRRRGTSGAQELLIPVGARTSALVGSNMASINGLEAVEWNMAGLAAIDGNGEAMFTHLNWLADIGISYFGVASSFGDRNTFGVTLKSLDFGKIPVTTELAPDGTGEYYSPNFITLGFLYARRMTDRILIGTSIKLVTESVMNLSARGAVIDAGVQYHTSTNGLKIGVSLRNLGLNMEFTGSDLEEYHSPSSSEPGTPAEPRRIPLQSFEMPTTLELGASYGPIDFGQVKLLLSTSFLNNNFSFDEYRAGTELSFMGILYLRGGFAMGYDPQPYGLDFEQDTGDEADDEQFEYSTDEFIWGPAFGFGLDLSKVMGYNIMIDYAYRSVEYFETNLLTLKVAF